MTAQEVRQTLMSNDVEFQRLASEHHRHSEQLEQLLEQPYRSAEDLLREAELKKKKLYLKDQMEQLIASRLSSAGWR